MLTSCVKALEALASTIHKLVLRPGQAVGELVESTDRKTPFRATHFVYLCLFILGAFAAANTLIVQVAPQFPYDKLFLIPLTTFAVTNCVHQYLIYRDLLQAEESSSDLYRRYGSWWIGTPLEIAIRLLGLCCLLVLSGKIAYEYIPAPGDLDERLNKATEIAVLASCSLYAVFLVWNLLARSLIRRRSKLKGDELDVAVADLNRSIVSDSLAFLMWACLIVALRWQPAAVVITMLTVLYAVNVLWFRSPARTRKNFADRLYRAYVAGTVLAFLLVLNWSDLVHAVESVLRQSSALLVR